MIKLILGLVPASIVVPQTKKYCFGFSLDIDPPASANSPAKLYRRLYVQSVNNVSSHLINYNFLLLFTQVIETHTQSNNYKTDEYRKECIEYPIYHLISPPLQFIYFLKR